MTSQSMVICRSPSAARSTIDRSERPIRRCISMVRPPCLPAEASRRVRSEVARGSMPYSAVIQPRPCPLSQGGRRSSRLAVTSTWVSPNFTKQEPSAYLTTPRSSETLRNSSTCRPLGRIRHLVNSVAAVLRSGGETGKRSISLGLLNLGDDELAVDVLGVELDLVAGLDRREHGRVLHAVDHGHAVIHVEFLHRAVLDGDLFCRGIDLLHLAVGQGLRTGKLGVQREQIG